MTVEYDESLLEPAAIISAVTDAGYSASLAGVKLQDQTAEKTKVQEEIEQMKQRTIVSLIFMILLMYVAMGPMLGLPVPSFLVGVENAAAMALVQFLLTLPVVYVNRQYYQTGFKTLWRRSPNMDSLIAIGSAAAILYGVFAMFRIGWGLGHNDLELVLHYSHDLYFESGSMILALITLGKYLEARSKGRTSDAIAKLIDLAPKAATVIRDGQEVEIPVAELAEGDIVVIRPGQSIPVDGVIIEGSSAVDESALTGESIPVAKTVGDKVISATINKAGAFRFRATRIGDDTTLAQIIRLVEEASSSKAPIAKLADKISGIFVPVVIAIALAAFVIWLLLGYPFEFALTIGVAVLVISCPCALGLATPVAIMVGTGKGAELGILIKGGEALEASHKIDAVVLDKTGTITEGKPRLTDIRLYGDITEEQALFLCASAERGSEHPIAKAVVQEAENRGMKPDNPSSFTAVPGRGIDAVISGQRVLVGNLKLMNENDIDTQIATADAGALAASGRTLLYVAADGKLHALMAASDTVKQSSAEAIFRLRSMGLDIYMITGDNRNTAQAIAKEVGIQHILSDVLPADKAREIKRLQDSGKRLPWWATGLTTPCSCSGDVGMAIGTGTDVAVGSADVVLMGGDLNEVATAIALSKATIRNIKQNLFWAFIYNTIGIPFAARSLLYLWRSPSESCFCRRRHGLFVRIRCYKRPASETL